MLDSYISWYVFVICLIPIHYSCVKINHELKCIMKYKFLNVGMQTLVKPTKSNLYEKNFFSSPQKLVSTTIDFHKNK